VALIGGSFLALIARPFLFEFGGGHLIADGNARSVANELTREQAHALPAGF
jgi:hypothetical protein